MTTKFHLIITKTELTLNGVNLGRRERADYTIAPAIGGIQNPEAVRHHTVLLDRPFRTAKAAWVAATPELIDGLGLVWEAGRGTYDTHFAGYDINVARA